MRMTEHSYLAMSPLGFHRIAYTQWGAQSGAPQNERVLICAHGMTRNCRDFDFLARDMSESWRVLCPDGVGRGRSDWLADPAFYTMTQSLSDMAALIARSGVERVDWVGTSIGGLIGLVLAAMPGSPIRRLVLNDIGSFIRKEALEEIKAYLGKTPTFANIDDVVAYMREINNQVGELSDAQWLHIAETSVRRADDGSSFVLCYDPLIAKPFEVMASADVDMWEYWDAVKCPVLVLHGLKSALLESDTVAQMKARHGDCKVVEWPNCGHAPSLMQGDQIRVVREFLER